MQKDDVPQAPSGWYPRAEGEPGERFWDGSSWTGEVRGVPVVNDPGRPEERSANEVDAQARPFFKNKFVLLASAVVVVVILVIVGVVSSSGQSKESAKITVPDLKGLTLAQAEDKLFSLGLEAEEALEELSSVSSTSDCTNGKIVAQLPAAGTKISADELVEVDVCRIVSSSPKASSAPVAPWYPSGFTSYSTDLAYKWVTGGPDPCGSLACKYWTMQVISHYGCPRGVYAEINTLSNKVNVGWTNDSLASLAAGQTGQLQFKTTNKTVDSASIAKMSCHR